MGSPARQFEDFYRIISADIFKFCEAMRFQPTWQQVQLLEAVQRGDLRIACRSGQGPGKTTVSAVVGLWRLLRPWSKLIVTAPTMRQCKDAWLAEAALQLRKAHPMLRKIYKVNSMSIGMFGQKSKDWGAILITATKSENAQGQHRPNMDVIAEEASGISRELIEQFKGTLSNPNALFLQIGNPNSRECAFFDCFHSKRHLWSCLHWNAEETPDSEWFTQARNKELEDEFGRDSDVYRIRVLGEFPHADPNCVMSSEDLEKVMDRKMLLAAARLCRANGTYAKQFGQDFARFGGDESTIYRRSGNAIVEWKYFNHVEPSDVVDEAFAMQKNASWRDEECWYVPDAGGMGQGVMHMYYEAGKNVVEFHTQNKAVDADYENRMTEAYFHLARLVKRRHCYLPDDNRLMQQLATRHYYTTKKGKLVLESKDEYMKRGFDSPDRGDGTALAMYDEVEACGHLSVRGKADYQVGTKARNR